MRKLERKGILKSARRRGGDNEKGNSGDRNRSGSGGVYGVNDMGSCKSLPNQDNVRPSASLDFYIWTNDLSPESNRNYILNILLKLSQKMTD